MANCGYQCTELPDHEKAVCGEFLKGGNSSIGILDCDHTITNFSLAAQYTTNINAGNLVLIEPIVGEVPAPSPVEGANPSGCGSATILDTFDRQIKFRDYNVLGNVDFYNALNRRKTFAIIYECTNEKVTVILVAITWTAFRVIPPNEREKQYWDVTGKYTDLDEPEIYTAPAGIFNQ
jgi:hypothetical protein